MAQNQNTPIVKQPAIFSKVKELQPASKGVNLTVVVERNTVVVEKTRVDQSKIRIAECLLGDDSGCITFTARNEQVDLLQPGSYVNLRNAKVDMFNGFMRLTVDRWGKIEPIAKQDFKINTENNLSKIEYELVTVNH